MKKLKKIWMGMLTVSLFALVFLGLSPHGAVAATQPQNFQSDPATLFNTTFQYKNGEIFATITDTAATDQPQYDLTFIKNSTNSLEYDTSQQLFCKSNVQIEAAPAIITLTKAPSGSSFVGNLSANVRVQGGSACESYKATETVQNNDTSIGGTVAPPTTLTYNGGTYEQIGGTNLFGLNKTKGTDCYGGSVILANGAVSSGTAFVGLTNGGATALQPSLISSGADSKIISLITGCGFQDPSANTAGYAGSISNGKLNAPTPSAATGSSNDTTQSCVGTDVGDGDLDWIICPIVKGVGEAGNLMNGFIEGQLNYDVGANLGGTTGSIHKAWTIFKDLISAVLVIILLIMVISQAIGGGPFEAYTIRKILPKLVVAVIGMQISWSVGIYLIQLANDAGQGIGQLIAAPFGGLAALDLPALMARLHPAWSATFGGWVGVLVVGIGVYLFWPMMLLGAFTLLVAVAAAMATLLIRNALIVLAIISAPLAILAWVLPGTQKFWKYWSSNFSKALMLFPLVMGLIYGGRIFGWVAGNLGKPGPFDFLMVFAGFVGPYIFLPKTFKWGGSILAQANNGVIKARDWASKRPQGYFKARQEGWNTERQRRSQERYGGKREYSTWEGNRKKGQWYKPGSKWFNRPLDRFKSGELDPTLGGKDSRRKFEATAGYKAAGRESSGKTFETAKNAAQQLFDSAQDHDNAARMMARGEKFEYLDKQGRKQTFDPRGNPYWRAAGFNGIAKYGTDGSWRVFQAELDRLRAEGGDSALLADEILDDGVERVKPKMDSMYRGFNRFEYEKVKRSGGTEQASIRAARIGSIQSSVESMKDDWFGGMEGVEAQSLLAGLSHDIADGTPESAAKSTELMKKLWQDYKTAAANPNIRIAPGVHKAFKAYADGNPTSTTSGSLDDINTARAEEIMDVGKGDLVNEDGSITRVGEKNERKVIGNRQAVLDTIERNDRVNRGLIQEIGAIEFMSHFNGDGAQVRDIPRGAIVSGNRGPGPAGPTTPSPAGSGPRPNAPLGGGLFPQGPGIFSRGGGEVRANLRGPQTPESLSSQATTLPIDHQLNETLQELAHAVRQNTAAVKEVRRTPSRGIEIPLGTRSVEPGFRPVEPANPEPGEEIRPRGQQ